MRRANDKDDSGATAASKNASATGARGGGGGGGRAFPSFSETVRSVLVNPRRNAGFFAVLAFMTFLFYMTSYSSPTSSSSYNEMEGQKQGDGRLNKKTSSLRHGNNNNNKPGSSVTGTDQDPCTIWLAPSSLKGNPGYGIFTTRNISSGDAVLGGPDGLSIPIEDYGDREGAEWGKKKTHWINLWDNYWWGRGVPDHVSFEAGTDVVDYQIAFGAMPNHHCLLHSLNPEYPEPPYNDALVSRFSDAGAGAFSYSMGREFTVYRDIPAGSELFLDYGYCQHDDSVPDWTEHIFMTADFEKAARLVWRQITQPSSHILFDNEEGSENDMVIIPPGTTKLVAALLPTDRTEFEYMKANVHSKDDLAEFLAVYKGLNTKTVQDIREHGMCLERMKPGKSTIKGAGQGGFAQYKIHKDEMIVPAPVLHIMDKDALALHDDHGDTIGTQLLINYCLSHPDSTVLLCPDTNALLINHCSTRMKEWQQYCPNGPNAIHRWSSGWDATSDIWKNMTLDLLSIQTARGLALEIIATRDIEVGEEVFMDYGEEWELAWQHHVASWKPPPQTNETWITAMEANDQPKAPIMESFISHDLRYIKEHPYLFTGCQYSPSEQDRKKEYKTASLKVRDDGNPIDWLALTDAEILETYSTDGGRFVYPGKGYRNHYDTSHWPCAIIKQEDNTRHLTYTVRILDHPGKNRQPWSRNHVPRILTNYPRDSIHYFVHPYESDQHLPGVFRHPMGFRKDQFPEQWKNIEHRNLRRHFL